MSARSILTLYISRLFTRTFVLTSLVVLVIIAISNVFDTLQSFKNYSMSLRDFWLLVIFKIPDIFNEIGMLIALISTTIFIQILRKNNELIIIITNGIPISRIFLIPAVLSLFFGFVLLSINSSLGPHFLVRYKNLESKISGNKNSTITISQSGIFFSETFQGTKRIVQVRSINVDKKLLENITIISFDADGNFIERIDADSAVLASGFYKIKKGSINSSYKMFGENNTKIIDNLRLPTNLLIDTLKTRFDPPKLIGFWNLPSLINKFQKSGLVPTKYQLYYYKQLFKPISLLSMCLVACCFITLNLRNIYGNYAAAFSVIIGIMIFFLQEILAKILAYNAFSPMIAILMPIITIIFISVFVILHFQEA